MFKDVYREVGLLEVFVTLLQRFAGQMKLKPEDTNEVARDGDEELGYLVMECLGVLLVGSANNAAVFRESGGARCAHNLIPFSKCRREALGILCFVSCLISQLVILSDAQDLYSS